MEMLVGEQEQEGVALLLDPAARRSLISPFRISRKCRMFVDAAVSGGSYDALDLLKGGSVFETAGNRSREASRPARASGRIHGEKE
jgi:hypothetical protein